ACRLIESRASLANERDELVERARCRARRGHSSITDSGISRCRRDRQIVRVLLIPDARHVPFGFSIFALRLDQKIHWVVSARFTVLAQCNDRQSKSLIRQHVNRGCWRPFLFNLMSPPSARERRLIRTRRENFLLQIRLSHNSCNQSSSVGAFRNDSMIESALAGPLAQ